MGIGIKVENCVFCFTLCSALLNDYLEKASVPPT